MSLDLFFQSPATIALLVANVVLSVWGFSSPKLIYATLFDMRAVVKDRQYQRLITSGFVHGDPMHLFMNMLALFFLGPYVEYFVGTLNYVVIYFVCLLAGSLWTLMENFRNLDYKALGASGAISGVTAAFALFQPFAMLLVFVIPMPAILFAVLYIAWSAYAQGRVNDGIGHGAHLGGALAGVVMVCLFWPQAPRSMWEQIVAFFQR